MRPSAAGYDSSSLGADITDQVRNRDAVPVVFFPAAAVLRAFPRTEIARIGGYGCTGPRRH